MRYMNDYHNSCLVWFLMLTEILGSCMLLWGLQDKIDGVVIAGGVFVGLGFGVASIWGLYSLYRRPKFGTCDEELNKKFWLKV